MPGGFRGRPPLALLHNGDMITMNIAERLLAVDLTIDELADRKTQWTAPEIKVKKGWLSLYTTNCRPASEGAAMQPWSI